MRRVLASLGLAGVLLAVAALPAHAAQSSVTGPAANAEVTGPTNLRVAVTTPRTERVRDDGVLVRFMRDGRQYARAGILRLTGGPTSGGRSEWAAGLDPLRSWMDEGLAMPNGLYQLQAQVTVITLTGDRHSEWRGHTIRLRVPPPPTPTTSRALADDAVEVSWQPVTLPDFLRYEVQRSVDGAAWTAVTAVEDADVTEAVDSPPAGSWQYRTLVVRSDGEGGELVGPAAVADPGLDPAAPAPPPPTSDPGAPVPAPDPGPSEPGEPGAPGAPGAPVGPGPTPVQPAPAQIPTANPRSRGAGSPRLLTPVTPVQGVQVGTPLDSPAVAANGPLDGPIQFEQAAASAVEPDVRLDAFQGQANSTLAVASSGRAAHELMRALGGGLLLMVSAGHVSRKVRKATPTDGRP